MLNNKLEWARCSVTYLLDIAWSLFLRFLLDKINGLHSLSVIAG